ncbi:hypothetical protein HOLleu_37937 [Holothuria leucospilota]|uniref:Uncharacterized protein n=1 Tax=Holothuria leucospilota TaxID=206669 RepID=A0A9Q1BEW1_HOLLE|nr:hypothetical protein HOLleu_37937 [Holothuria leucospilota]
MTPLYSDKGRIRTAVYKRRVNKKGAIYTPPLQEKKHPAGRNLGPPHAQIYHPSNGPGRVHDLRQRPTLRSVVSAILGHDENNILK